MTANPVSDGDGKIAEADGRTTPLGLYNYACSYHQAARALRKMKFPTTHPGSPVSFLYFHAIELFLKSFLRLHGHTTEELSSRKFGHDYGRMRDRAVELGLDLMDEDCVVLDHLEHTDVVIRARYLKTGYYEEPTLKALERTAKSLRESVRDQFKKKNIHARR